MIKTVSIDNSGCSNGAQSLDRHHVSNINDSIKMGTAWKFKRLRVDGCFVVLEYTAEFPVFEPTLAVGMKVFYNNDGREVFRENYPLIPSVSRWQRFKNWIKELF